MSTSRAEWYANYREHRKAATLWKEMLRATDFDDMPSFVTAVPGCESFSHCRLWGDQLGVFSLRDSVDRKRAHRCRMSFDRIQPRLPA